MPVDETALAYVQERAQDRPYHLLSADPDASYELETSYDLSTLSPMVTVFLFSRMVVAVPMMTVTPP